MTTMLDKAAAAMWDEMRVSGDLLFWQLSPADAEVLSNIARAALQAIRGMDGHGIDLNYWSERVVDAILNEKTT